MVPQFLDVQFFPSLLSLLLLFGRFTDIPSCSETLPSAVSSLLLSPLKAVFISESSLSPQLPTSPQEAQQAEAFLVGMDVGSDT